MELSFNQLSAFERQVQTIGNISVYFVESPRRDEFLTTFSREDWRKLSTRIQYVAFVYDDMYNVVSAGSWLSDVNGAFEKMPLPGYGIVLFSCGCVVPNDILTETRSRFGGFECLMLPGLVMSKEHVTFIDVKMPGDRCKRRESILSSPWYDEHSWKLQRARDEHLELRTKLSSITA